MLTGVETTQTKQGATVSKIQVEDCVMYEVYDGLVNARFLRCPQAANIPGWICTRSGKTTYCQTSDVEAQ